MDVGVARSVGLSLLFHTANTLNALHLLFIKHKAKWHKSHLLEQGGMCFWRGPMPTVGQSGREREAEEEENHSTKTKAGKMGKKIKGFFV